MNGKTKVLITLAAIAGVIGYGVSDGGTCTYHYETRLACEDFPGFCEPLAWNYKIWYRKYYRCCYDQNGNFTHRELIENQGPTAPVEGDCCQSLVYVGWEDWKWLEPCAWTLEEPT